MTIACATVHALGYGLIGVGVGVLIGVGVTIIALRRGLD